MPRILIENVDVVTLQEVKKNCGILLEDQKIRSVFSMAQKPDIPLDQIYDGRGAWAIPGLMDLHIHGFGGYGAEQGTVQALWALSEELAKRGVAAFCPTLYCAQPDAMKKLLIQLAPAVGKETGAQILGFHLEGPFLSPFKPGAMKPKDIIPPNLQIAEELYQAAEGKIAIMTMAPELENISEIVNFCHEHAILPQAGHTNATYEEFCHGVELGITHATHAFNAMSPFTQRAPGAAGAVLLNAAVSCEMIGDGAHVHPHIISFLRTVKKENQLVLITDALTPTEQQTGPFIANGEEVLLEGGVWRRKTDHAIVGSALTLVQGIKNLVTWGYPLPLAVRCASYNPAQKLHLANRGQLAPGFQADITLLTKDFAVQDVFIRAKRITR